MKFKALSISAIAALLLCGACSGEKGKSIEEAKPTTQIDSVSYYVGLLNANTYWQYVKSDTSLNSDAARAEFAKAFAKGISMIEGSSETYRAGLLAGMQLAMSSMDFDKAYGKQINLNLAKQGYLYGMTSDSLVNNDAAKKYLQEFAAKAMNEKREANTKSATGKLANLESKGFKKLTPLIYVKVDRPGKGDLLKSGDKVNVSYKFATEDGKSLSLPMPTQHDVVIGQTYPADFPLAAALSSMHMGETATFAMPADALLQGQQRQFKVDEDGLILVTITTSAPKEEAK